MLSRQKLSEKEKKKAKQSNGLLGFFFGEALTRASPSQYFPNILKNQIIQ
jgi:hypothetical protein